MKQIYHSLHKQNRWQRRNKNKQKLYQERYCAKCLIRDGSPRELSKMLSLIQKRLYPNIRLSITVVHKPDAGR